MSKNLTLLFCCLCFCVCLARFSWDEPKDIISYLKQSVTIWSQYMDPETLITHLIVAEGSDTVYMQVDFQKKVLVKRSLAPLDRFYALGEACLSGDGPNITIVADVVFKEDQSSQIWYMNSYDGGKTWTEYKKIQRKKDDHIISRSLRCPLVYVKETKRLTAIYTMNNLSSNTRPLILAMASKLPGSKVFNEERIIANWPMYRSIHYALSAYTFVNNMTRFFSIIRFCQ